MITEASTMSNSKGITQDDTQQSVPMETKEYLRCSGGDGILQGGEEEQESVRGKDSNNGEADMLSEAEQQQEDVIPPAKFDTHLARVYARDESDSGLLYKAVVRKKLYGTAPPKQVKIGLHDTAKSIRDAVENQTESLPTWHYFVHYLGWNVKWDRWVEQECLYEMTDETTQLAQQLEQEIKKAKQKTRDKQKAMAEFKRRMQEITNKNKPNADEEEKRNSQSKRLNLAREKQLHQAHLSGRKNNANQHNIVLPFALKKIMVEEWEIVTQCDMVHRLPAEVSVYRALQEYLNVKLANYKQDAETTRKEDDDTTPRTEQEDEKVAETKEKIREWTDMVDGICLLFDQALSFRLLYPQEVEQEDDYDYYASSADSAPIKCESSLAVAPSETSVLNNVTDATSMDATDDKTEKKEETLVDEDRVPQRPCQVYGCEFLLRLLVHLPQLLEHELLLEAREQMRPIMSKIHDLIRYLQKHQSTLFLQRYKKRIHRQKGRTKKRKVVA